MVPVTFYSYSIHGYVWGLKINLHPELRSSTHINIPSGKLRQ